MMTWIKSQWLKLATAVAGLLLLASVYFLGRRTRSGDLDFAAAKRELELADKQSSALQTKLDDVEGQRLKVVEDILSEEIALSLQKEKNHELDPEDVVRRLRDHGLIK